MNTPKIPGVFYTTAMTFQSKIVKPIPEFNNISFIPEAGNSQMSVIAKRHENFQN